MAGNTTVKTAWLIDGMAYVFRSFYAMRSMAAPDGTPMANALLSLMHALGFEDMDSFGDSTGPLPLNYPV